MKILVFGKSGQLGSQLFRDFRENKEARDDQTAIIIEVNKNVD